MLRALVSTAVALVVGGWVLGRVLKGLDGPTATPAELGVASIALGVVVGLLAAEVVHRVALAMWPRRAGG